MKHESLPLSGGYNYHHIFKTLLDRACNEAMEYIGSSEITEQNAEKFIGLAEYASENWMTYNKNNISFRHENFYKWFCAMLPYYVLECIYDKLDYLTNDKYKIERIRDAHVSGVIY